MEHLIQDAIELLREVPGWDRGCDEHSDRDQQWENKRHEWLEKAKRAIDLRS